MQLITRPSVRPEFNNKQFRRKEQILELIIFLFLIAPSMALSFFMPAGDGHSGFAFTAVSSILRDLALVGLVLFFLWRNGEPLRTVGWDFTSLGREAAVGLGLFIPFYLGIGLLETFLQLIGFSVMKSPPPQLAVNGRSEVLLALALVTVVAVAEETIFRGYLIARFNAITRSAGAAVLLAALIFSLGHGYEGSAGVVTVGVVGMLFGWIYIKRGSIVAPVVMHFLLDFIGIVLLPLLSRR